MNSSTDGGAPAWLFSFVDLAFLMVIAMTQLAPDPGAVIPDLGEMIVPRVGSNASTEMAASASEVWQLRVHPPADPGLAEELVDPPFELIRVVAGVPSDDDQRGRLQDHRCGRQWREHDGQQVKEPPHDFKDHPDQHGL